jgi:D-sedoheptulose 7-phosphate isomerase
MDHIRTYLHEVREIAETIDQDRIAAMIRTLVEIRAGQGRLFFLGVGGGAGNASHAVNDFRKICGFEAYSPLDNVSEMARAEPAWKPGWNFHFFRGRREP